MIPVLQVYLAAVEDIAQAPTSDPMTEAEIEELSSLQERMEEIQVFAATHSAHLILTHIVAGPANKGALVYRYKRLRTQLTRNPSTRNEKRPRVRPLVHHRPLRNFETNIR